MSRVVLSATNLAIGYPRPRHPARIVVENINLELRAGELVCLLGPNGAGKSTLLRTLSGIAPPIAGEVRLGGKDITKLKPTELAKRLGVVLTDRVEAGMLTGYALVALGRHPYTNWSGRLSRQDEQVVRHSIEAVGAIHLAARPITELSDGERQKLMIARALAQEAELLILDEPTAFLDLPRRVDILRTLRKLAYEAERAVLVSTHDLDLALRSADRIWLLPPGGPITSGAPEDLVLNGSFQQTFYSEGVTFNSESGSFQMVDNWLGQVTLIGEGLRAIWTARALERNGFQVIKDKTNTDYWVEVLPDGLWRMTYQEIRQEFQSLYSLIQHLKTLFDSKLHRNLSYP